MKQKKSIQLNQAFTAVLTLVLVAILVIITIYLVSSLQGNFYVSTVGSTINETITPTTAGVALTNSYRTNSVCTATLVTNGTGTVTLTTENYTISGCVMSNLTNMDLLNPLNVSYTYSYSENTAASNASGSIITQFATYPALIGLVGTIIFLALVIGVLVASFAFGKRGV